MNKKFRKKLLLVIAVAIMGIALVTGCGSKKENVPNDVVKRLNKDGYKSTDGNKTFTAELNGEVFATHSPNAKKIYEYKFNDNVFVVLIIGKENDLGVIEISASKTENEKLVHKKTCYVQQDIKTLECSEEGSNDPFYRQIIESIWADIQRLYGHEFLEKRVSEYKE